MLKAKEYSTNRGKAASIKPQYYEQCGNNRSDNPGVHIKINLFNSYCFRKLGHMKKFAQLREIVNWMSDNGGSTVHKIIFYTK